MKMPERRNVETDTRLDISYYFHEATNPHNDDMTVALHGFAHSHKEFEDMRIAINHEGVHMALVNLNSEHDNGITFGEHVVGFHEALTQIQRDTGRRIASVGGHSMGGKIVKKTKIQYPEWRRPTVLMAPIPEKGAGMAVIRAAWKDPIAHITSSLTQDVRFLLTETQVGRMFFDARTMPSTVRDTTIQMRRTSYASFLNLLGVNLHTPWSDTYDEDTLLIRYQDDFLFPPHSYDDLRKFYPNLEVADLPGGHDSFIENWKQTADAYVRFHKKHSPKKR